MGSATTHPVLIVNPIVPEVDKVDNVCVRELGEPLEYLDEHLLTAALTVRVAYLVPDHLHPIVCVHGQEGSINAGDITGNLQQGVCVG